MSEMLDNVAFSLFTGKRVQRLLCNFFCVPYMQETGKVYFEMPLTLWKENGGFSKSWIEMAAPKVRVKYGFGRYYVSFTQGIRWTDVNQTVSCILNMAESAMSYEALSLFAFCNTIMVDYWGGWLPGGVDGRGKGCIVGMSISMVA